MNKKWIALAMAAALLAGCAASPSSQASSALEGSSDAAGPVATPVYSYVDPHPEMVFAKLPSGEITYADYRLYIDVNEQLERASARRNLALTRMLEKDLAELKIEVDEADFEQVAGQELLGAYTQQGYAEAMEKMKTLLGIDDDKLIEAIKTDFRPQYLINLRYTRELEKAEKNHPAGAAPAAPAQSEAAPAAPAQSEAAPAASDASAPAPTAEELAAQAEQERQAAINAEAGAEMDAYSAGFETRCILEKGDELLAVLDGEKLPLTEADRLYLNYAGMAGRLNQLTTIQAGEAMLRELEAKGKAPDYDKFLTESFEPYIESMRSSEEALAQLGSYLEGLGATVDDFAKAIERPMWLNTISYDFPQMILDEYAALAESADKPTQEDYYTQRVTALLEGAELLNETGK